MEFDIEEIELGDNAALLNELVACWQASVEVTHAFLSSDDIERIVSSALKENGADPQQVFGGCR